MSRLTKDHYIFYDAQPVDLKGFLLKFDDIILFISITSWVSPCKLRFTKALGSLFTTWHVKHVVKARWERSCKMRHFKTLLRIVQGGRLENGKYPTPGKCYL